MIKRVFTVVLVGVLALSHVNVLLTASAVEKKEYVIMTPDEEGEGYTVSTESMTHYEAMNYRIRNRDKIIDVNNIVEASKNPNELTKENKKHHNKKTKKKQIKEYNYEWYLQQINADSSDVKNYINVVNGNYIKVAILDSGVDYSTDIDVYKRKNFIPGEDDISIIYEDISGHGTSVAGVIAAKDNGSGATGVNPNIALYSAKVLDKNNTAPISRIIDAIYWAIDEKINIINISFGTREDSIALNTAIKDALDAGIIVVAAAGNKGSIEYPAAYEGVIAVGSVDNQGEVSDFSPIDERIDVVAPGEFILSTGSFDGVSVSSGTSMSAPIVTGIISVLWQQDNSMPASFIKEVVNASSNLYGNHAEYGYGLVDLKYALSVYELLKEQIDDISLYPISSDESTFISVDDENLIFADEIEIEANENEIVVFNEVPFVEGSWYGTRHESYITSSSFSLSDLRYIKIGTVANDIYIGGMTTYPQWHGYWQRQIAETSTHIYESNYVASYIYLTKMAMQFKSTTNKYTDPAQPTWLTTNDYNGLKGVVSDYGFVSQPWIGVIGTEFATTTFAEQQKMRKLVVYGMAIHSATDAFAHSTYTPTGTYISHSNGVADDTTYIPSRDACASLIAKYALEKLAANQEGTVNEFISVAQSSAYDQKFKVRAYGTNLSLVNSSINASNYSTISYK